MPAEVGWTPSAPDRLHRGALRPAEARRWEPETGWSVASASPVPLAAGEAPSLALATVDEAEASAAVALERAPVRPPLARVAARHTLLLGGEGARWTQWTEAFLTVWLPRADLVAVARAQPSLTEGAEGRRFEAPYGRGWVPYPWHPSRAADVARLGHLMASATEERWARSPWSAWSPMPVDLGVGTHYPDPGGPLAQLRAGPLPWGVAWADRLQHRLRFPFQAVGSLRRLPLAPGEGPAPEAPSGPLTLPVPAVYRAWVGALRDRWRDATVVAYMAVDRRPVWGLIHGLRGADQETAFVRLLRQFAARVERRSQVAGRKGLGGFMFYLEPTDPRATLRGGWGRAAREPHTQDEAPALAWREAYQMRRPLPAPYTRRLGRGPLTARPRGPWASMTDPSRVGFGAKGPLEVYLALWGFVATMERAHAESRAVRIHPPVAPEAGPKGPETGGPAGGPAGDGAKDPTDPDLAGWWRTKGWRSMPETFVRALEQVDPWAEATAAWVRRAEARRARRRAADAPVGEAEAAPATKAGAISVQATSAPGAAAAPQGLEAGPVGVRRVRETKAAKAARLASYKAQGLTQKGLPPKPRGRKPRKPKVSLVRGALTREQRLAVLEAHRPEAEAFYRAMGLGPTGEPLPGLRRPWRPPAGSTPWPIPGVGGDTADTAVSPAGAEALESPEAPEAAEAAEDPEVPDGDAGSKGPTGA